MRWRPQHSPACTRRVVEGHALEEFFSLADVHIQWSEPQDVVNVYLWEGNAIGIFPLGNELVRIVLAHADQTPEADPQLPEFQTAIDTWSPKGAQLSSPRWMSRFRISQRQVHTYRAARRAFLAGDASHIHSPMGGQGMNTCIQDVCNLAWKLALVLEGRARESLLDSYNAERKPIGTNLLRATGFASSAAFFHGGLIGAIRDRVLAIATSFSSLQEKLLEGVSEVGINYRDSSIVREEFHGRGPKG